MPASLDAGLLPRGRGDADFLPGRPSPPGPDHSARSDHSARIPARPEQASRPDHAPQHHAATAVPSRDRPVVGFAAGDVLDVALPGPALAGPADTAAERASPTRGSVTMNGGVLTAWRRRIIGVGGGLSAPGNWLVVGPPRQRPRHPRRGPRPVGQILRRRARRSPFGVAVGRGEDDRVAHDLATRLPLTRQALHEGSSTPTRPR